MKNVKEVKIEVKGKDWLDAIDKAYNKNKKDIKMAGFRKGAVPKEIYIKKLNAHEIEPVEMVLTGEIKLELSGSSYYLQAFATSNQRDIIEQGEAYRKARRYNRTTNRTVRLIGGAVISLALGILTVNDFMRGDDAQAWMNLVTRIANLFTALFSGWLSGAADVKLEANSIENKTDVLKLFKSAYDKKLFAIYSEEEEAKKEYEEQEKAKEQAINDILERDEVLKLQNQSNQIEMK